MRLRHGRLLGGAVSAALALGAAAGVAAGALTFRSVTRSGSQVMLAVTPVERSGPETDDSLSSALSAAVFEELRELENDSLLVMAWRPTMSYDRTSRIIRNRTKPTGIDFVLEGGIEPDPSIARVTFRLISVATGAESWTARFPLPDGESRQTAQHVARAVAAALRRAAAREQP